MLSRTGVSARTSAGVYDTNEPDGDQRGLTLLLDPPPLRPPQLLADADIEKDGAEYDPYLL